MPKRGKIQGDDRWGIIVSGDVCCKRSDSEIQPGPCSIGPMSILKLLLPAFVLGLTACGGSYHTPSSISLPMTQGPSGNVQDSPHARPTVRFPARVAVAKIEATDDGFRLGGIGSPDPSKYTSKGFPLPGIRGTVNLNGVSLLQQVQSYRELDREALKLGADLLVVYRTGSEVKTRNAVRSLGLLLWILPPTTSYEASAVVTLIVRDARTGYTYGVLEERADLKGLTPGVDDGRPEVRKQQHAEDEAMAKLIEKLPAFWDGVIAKGR